MQPRFVSRTEKIKDPNTDLTAYRPSLKKILKRASNQKNRF